jgi:transcription antitermination factor NusB
MIINQLNNRRKTREYLLMFFYSKEIENFKFDQIEPQIADYFQAFDSLMEEEDFVFIQEYITDVFNSVKVTKLDQDDKIGFIIPGSNKEHTMSFKEMDEENIKDGFLAYSYKLAELLKVKKSKNTSQSKRDKSATNNFDFFKAYFSKYESNLESIDLTIEKKLENWDFSRISVIDKLIIRMGIVEFLYFPEIPEKVIINEAIELGKKFSSEKSNVFINGILNKFKDELRVENKIN